MLSSKSFYEQVIKIREIDDRKQFFLSHCENKSVLHVGCADWPVYDQNTNLHLYLYNRNNRVEGFDTNTEVIEKMRTVISGPLHTTLPNKKYDVILIPETIEHVPNPETFLKTLVPLAHGFSKFIITAPNAFCETWMNGVKYLNGTVEECVHPDHYCWYSPYTLANLVRRTFSSCDILDIGVIDKRTMVYVIFSIG